MRPIALPPTWSPNEPNERRWGLRERKAEKRDSRTPKSSGQQQRRAGLYAPDGCVRNVYNMLLLLLAAALVALCAAAAPPQGLFEPRCTSSDQYGWPRFDNSTSLRDSKWAIYFTAVYGSLPASFPVCVYDLWSINPTAYAAAGLTGSRELKKGPQLKELKEGDFYVGAEGYSIYHGQWKPVPNNTWVEVAHAVFPTEITGAWVWTLRGSSIWYNVGKTIVFPTPKDPNQVHEAAIAWLKQGCSVNVSTEWPLMESQIFGDCAREKGINSIQFSPAVGEEPIGTFGLTGMTEMVLVDVDGDKGCGVTNATATPLRSGWEASERCGCTNGKIAPSCGLMAKPPFPYSLIGEEPPLCGLRAHDRKASCNPLACAGWTCAREPAATGFAAAAAAAVATAAQLPPTGAAADHNIMHRTQARFQ